MSQPQENRSYLLPKGCKDLADVLKVANKKKARVRKCAPLKTNEEVWQVLRRYVPELNDGSLEIVSTARIVGRRCLVVVRSVRAVEPGQRRISLRRGPALNALIEELAGKYPSISFWKEPAEAFIRQSFCGPGVSVTIHPSKAATVTLNKTLFGATHSQSAEAQRKSEWQFYTEMVQLVSEVTGWKISFEVV